MATTSKKSASKDKLLDGILGRLQSGGRKRETFYLTLEDGRLKIGWISQDPDESLTREERILHLGEQVTVANVEQSIESQLKP